MAPVVVRSILYVSSTLSLLGLLVVALAYIRLQKAVKTPGKLEGSRSPEAWRWKWRFWIVFWWVWFLSLGTVFIIAGIYKDGHKRIDPDTSRLWAFPVFVLLAGFFHLGCWRRMALSPARPVESSEVTDEKVRRAALLIQPKPDAKPKPAPLWVWVLVIGIFAVFLYAFSPKKPQANPKQDVETGQGLGWTCLGSFGVLVVLVGFFMLQSRWKQDRVLLRANRRFQEGDLEGAISELQHEIEMRGPTADRLSFLASLFVQKKDYANALGWTRKSLAIEPKPVNLRLLLALCLVKTGSPEECVTVLDQVEFGDGFALGFLLECGEELIELGFLSRAELAIDQVDGIMRTHALQSQTDRESMESRIVAARARITEKRGEKHATGFPEL